MHHHRRRELGNSITSLLLVLAMLVAAGGYNYWRNLQREQMEKKPSPFKEYVTADLESLHTAYELEVGQAQDRFLAQNQRRVRASGQGLIAERVKEYNRVKRSTAKLRELKADLAAREAQLREIEEELGYRRSQLSGLKLHLKRLVTI